MAVERSILPAAMCRHQWRDLLAMITFGALTNCTQYTSTRRCKRFCFKYTCSIYTENRSTYITYRLAISHTVSTKCSALFLVTFLFLAKSVFSRAPSNYLLIGLDFMVTSDLSVKFIEANNYPLWPKGNDFIDRMMQQLGVRII